MKGKKKGGACDITSIMVILKASTRAPRHWRLKLIILYRYDFISIYFILCFMNVYWFAQIYARIIRLNT